MENYLSQEEISKIIAENKALSRRVERMTKETKNLVALHDRAVKLRDYSERERNLQFEYNMLLLESAPDMIFILDAKLRFRLGSKVFLNFLSSSSICGKPRRDERSGRHLSGSEERASARKHIAITVVKMDHDCIWLNCLVPPDTLDHRFAITCAIVSLK